MNRDFLKYLFSLLLYGANGIVASYIHMDSYEIVLLRSMLGAALLLLLFFLTGRRLTRPVNRHDLLFITLSGIMMASNWLFLYEAYTQIGVGLSMLLNYCGPIIVMALSPLVFKEKLRLEKCIALALALFGVVLTGGQAAAGGGSVFGVACGLLSAVCYAMMVVFSKLTREIRGLENTTIQLLATFLTAAVYVGLRQGYDIHPAASDWIPVLLLGLVNTGGACYFYFSAIGGLPVQTVAICGYLEPLAAVVLSALLLQERLSPLQLLGGACIILGALLGELGLPGKKRSPAAK